MNRTAAIADFRIEEYLAGLNAALKAVPEPEREDIVREIRAHILEATEAAADTEALDRVLSSLGAPQELGQRYLTQFEVSRASRSFSPWLLMRTAWRWATISAKGLAAFLIGFTGYAMGIVFYLTAMLKPLVPQIGLWIGPRTVEIGTPGSQAGLHEVLGPYYIPVAFVAGFGCFFGTSRLLRRLMRKTRVHCAPTRSASWT